MNFVSLALHGFKALMIFAEDVLIRVGIACASVAMFSIFSIAIVSVLKLVGLSTPGWFSISTGILLLMLLQTGALALMSLMLLGVVRGGVVAAPKSYRDFIDTIDLAPKPDLRP